MAAESSQSGPPVQKVLDMRKQGLTNNQIIQNLQQSGYDLDAIFTSMSLADAKGGVQMQPQHNQMQFNNNPNKRMMPFQNQPPDDFGMNSDYNNSNDNNNLPPPMDTNNFDNFGGMNQQNIPMDNQFSNQNDNMHTQQGNTYSSNPTTERIEELAEAIIDEKWNEIVRSINKIIDWKDRTESKITKIEQSIEDMKKQFDTLHKGVLGKIGEYDKNLSTIGSDIKAMEKVFSQVLPIMTENVNELSRITKDLKER